MFNLRVRESLNRVRDEIPVSRQIFPLKMCASNLLKESIPLGIEIVVEWENLGELSDSRNMFPPPLENFYRPRSQWKLLTRFMGRSVDCKELAFEVYILPTDCRDFFVTETGVHGEENRRR